MLTGIDHLVIACADPDAAAAELESTLGIACTAGGRHEDVGTWNRIAWLADGSYLELIGVTDPDAAAAWPVGIAALRTLAEQGAGLATYALLVDDLEVTAPESFGPAMHGSRIRDDGEVVEWWFAFPDEPLGPAVPFVIQHAYAGREWGDAAMAQRSRQVHPIGSPVTLSRLDVAVPDPSTLATWLGEQPGVDVRADSDLAVAKVGPHVVRLLPRREMAVPAVILLAADVETPRGIDLLGLRFDIGAVERPTSVPRTRTVTGTGS